MLPSPGKHRNIDNPSYKTELKVKEGQQNNSIELFSYFKNLKRSLLSIPYNKDHEPRHFNLLYYIHHIKYASASGISQFTAFFFCSFLTSHSTFSATALYGLRRGWTLVLSHSCSPWTQPLANWQNTHRFTRYRKYADINILAQPHNTDILTLIIIIKQRNDLVNVFLKLLWGTFNCLRNTLNVILKPLYDQH